MFLGFLFTDVENDGKKDSCSSGNPRKILRNGEQRGVITYARGMCGNGIVIRNVKQGNFHSSLRMRVNKELLLTSFKLKIP